jgi:hypothetical protein
MGKYRKGAEHFNSDIKVISEIVAAIRKNKSIGTETISGELQILW